MRKFLAFAVIILVTGYAQAWEFKDNPDRYPSVGVNLGGASELGTAVPNVGSGAPRAQGLTVSTKFIEVDLRMPVSNYITLTGSIGSTETKAVADRTAFLLGSETNTKGRNKAFDVGLRWYIH